MNPADDAAREWYETLFYLKEKGIYWKKRWVSDQALPTETDINELFNAVKGAFSRVRAHFPGKGEKRDGKRKA
jgi:hypothetical protein